MSKYQSSRVKVDPLDRINNQILAIVESEGCLPWHSKHWKANSSPRRSNNIPFTGNNVSLLTLAGMSNSRFSESRWFTAKQAIDLGGHVRKHEKSHALAVLLKNSVKVEDDGEEHHFAYARYYPVFNISQIDGLPDEYYNHPVTRNNPKIVELESWAYSIGAKINHENGCIPVYSPNRDDITLPPLNQFESNVDYYATLAHELGHYTFHHNRVVCDFGKGDQAYAREEIAVEILSANIMAHFGFEPHVREDHAPYIKGWLSALGNNKRFFVDAVGHASKAFDYLID